MATTAVLPSLSEKPRYPKLGPYPKYGDFILLNASKLNNKRNSNFFLILLTPHCHILTITTAISNII
jgi:hypothetical protein